jgi:hypothetical protein
VCNDRNRDYGDPEDNFADIASLWNTYMGNRVDSFTAVDVANLMVLTKVARAKTSPDKLDHYIDIAGYAVCGHACVEKQQSEQAQGLGYTVQICPNCLSSQRMYDERNPGWYECMNCGTKYEAHP